jgi:filamin
MGMLGRAVTQQRDIGEWLRVQAASYASDPPCLSPGFSIEGPSQAKIECDDKGDGSCDVRYWPTEPGEYAVHVICDDEDIRDSPFIAHIQPAPPDCFPDKVRSQLLHADWDRTGCTGPPPVPNTALLSGPPQVKAFGPGLEPTGCIVDRPAEFTIDARAAGKGDLKLYAQVGYWYCLSPLPHYPRQGLPEGRW